MANLPYEVLAYCFTLARSGYHWNGGSCKLRPEVLVSHVCSHWREVSLDQPRLWSTVRVPGRSYRRDRVQEYLARSLDQPITIHLDIGSAAWGEHLLAQLSSIIAAEDGWERVERLHLYGDAIGTMYDALMHLRSVYAPALKRLYVDSTGPHPTPYRAKLFNEFGVYPRHVDLAKSCPALSTISYDGWAISRCWPVTASPQILLLPNCVMPMASLRSMVSSGTITTLSMRGGVFDRDCDSSWDTLKMPRLRALEMKGVGRADDLSVGHFLAVLDAPQLEVVSLGDVGGNDFQSTRFPKVHQLVVRHHAKLTTSDTYRALACAMPNVVKLQIVADSGIGEALDVLLDSWSELTELSMDISFTDKGLVTLPRVLAHRKELCTPIALLAIRGRRDQEHDPLLPQMVEMKPFVKYSFPTL